MILKRGKEVNVAWMQENIEVTQSRQERKIVVMLSIGREMNDFWVWSVVSDWGIL